MEKQEKAAIASSNARKFKIGRREYAAVDERPHQLDKRVPTAEPCIKTCAIRVVRDRPSLMDIYRIEHWLLGKGFYQKSSVPKADRERILAEYNLQYDEGLRRYCNSEEALWELFLKKFPAKIADEHITSYGELLYRAKHRR